MHCTDAQCVDMARGTVTDLARTAIEHHMAECRQCAELLRYWRRVVEVAVGEAASDPPDAVVVAAKALFRARPASPAEDGLAARVRALVATLTFDTFQHAAPAGVRTGVVGPRQLVYEAPPFSVDLRLEATGTHIHVTGQIADADGTRNAGRGALVEVLASSVAIARALASKFGEFHCEFDERDGLSLFISLNDGRAIMIPLDRLPAPP